MVTCGSGWSLGHEGLSACVRRESIVRELLRLLLRPGNVQVLAIRVYMYEANWRLPTRQSTGVLLDKGRSILL